jgi:riboflavin kinase / FMN adenylyltransferase
MKVMENYQELISSHEPKAVALGNFDGIHLGHQALMKKLVHESHTRNLVSAVYTFQNHPGTVLDDHQKIIFPSKITPIPLKKKIMGKMGIELLFLDTFTPQLMLMSPEEFVKTILIDRLFAKLVVVGEDFRFGKAASGNIHLLQELATVFNYELMVVPPVYHDHQKISSSQIRMEIEMGNMEKVTQLLGRPFMMFNRIERGFGRGKKLGYPTANLILEEQQMVPAEGVYATCVRVDDKLFMGATSVGNNPTFGSQHTTIETYIIDSDLMLYEREIELYFYKKLRDQITFEEVEALKNQIQQDVQDIKDYLQTHKIMIV